MHTARASCAYLCVHQDAVLVVLQLLASELHNQLLAQPRGKAATAKLLHHLQSIVYT